jgi:hypothetical protein
MVLFVQRRFRQDVHGCALHEGEGAKNPPFGELSGAWPAVDERRGQTGAVWVNVPPWPAAQVVLKAGAARFEDLRQALEARFGIPIERQAIASHGSRKGGWQLLAPPPQGSGGGKRARRAREGRLAQPPYNLRDGSLVVVLDRAHLGASTGIVGEIGRGNEGLRPIEGSGDGTEMSKTSYADSDVSARHFIRPEDFGSVAISDKSSEVIERGHNGRKRAGSADLGVSLAYDLVFSEEETGGTSDEGHGTEDGGIVNK